MTLEPENHEIAEVFSEMAELLELQEGDRYRIRTFRHASRVIDNLEEPVSTLIRFGTFLKKFGIGEGVLRRVKEILQSGSCQDHRQLRASSPPGLLQILKIRGIGPKRARLLHRRLGINSVEQLEMVALNGQLARHPDVGAELADRILDGIRRWRRGDTRVNLATALLMGKSIVDWMQEEESIQKIALTGSSRRLKDTVGDLDVLVGTDTPEAAADRFLRMPGVADVILSGEGRCSVDLEEGQQVDLRIIPPERFGAGLHYFTGSQAHNIAIRVRGNRRKLKISEKGIYRRADNHIISSGEKEEDIFAAVGLPWIPPEIRENLGEIEAAEKGRLPKLVGEEDLRGDLHLHAQDHETIEEMASAAAASTLDYVALVAYAGRKRHKGGLDRVSALKRMKLIRSLEDQLGRVHLLAGVEVDIKADGTLGFDRYGMSKHDWVVATINSHFDMSGDAMTARIIRAMETGLVDCIAHPRGSILTERKSYPLDLLAIATTARKTGVALEVNGEPRRMDLDGKSCKKVKERGTLLALTSHAHRPEELTNRMFALAAARRGWIENKHVLNTRPVEEIAEMRKSRLRRFSISVPKPLSRLKGTLEHGPDIEVKDDLLLQLQGEPTDELKERLQQYMLNNDDYELHQALRKLSDNPLQLALQLLWT